MESFCDTNRIDHCPDRDVDHAVPRVRRLRIDRDRPTRKRHSGIFPRGDSHPRTHVHAGSCAGDHSGTDRNPRSSPNRHCHRLHAHARYRRHRTTNRDALVAPRAHADPHPYA
jgi:hypothetical protein